MTNKLTIFNTFLVLINIFNVGNTLAQEKLNYLKGYNKDIKGEILSYHSPIPDAKTSLLVRSVDEKLLIEWETAVIPENWKSRFVTFVWLGGIDVNEDSHQFNLEINNKHQFSFRNPINNEDINWKMKSNDGAILEYKNVMIDRHSDQMGFFFLTLPVEEYLKGKPVRLKIRGESADSRSWYMTFRYGPGQKVTLKGEPAVIREGNEHFQWLRLDIIQLQEKGSAEIIIANEKINKELILGLNRVRVKVPKVTEETKFPVEVSIGGKLITKQDYLFKPVQEKVIYLVHHSHIDIGYTHVQTEVEHAQWSFLEQCIQLARESQDNPKGSQFKWNVEVMWAVESYLRDASPEKRDAFIEAVKKGWIELDGLFGNELTGLCRPEELMQLLEASRKVGELCGVPVESAMISDVPGYTWGLVPVMAQYGIKYFSIGTNTFHRIGDIIETWGDKPFYWESPSGKEKVLCWLHEKGYSFFHTGLGYTQLDTKLKPEEIFEYVEQLDERNYPYQIIPFRYNIGSDNGPPDPDLAETVKKWNELYVTPRLRISTISEVFHDFELEHGDEIPVYRGDLTPYWEDGAASSAAETVINRATAEKLVQAEILWTLNKKDQFPEEKFTEAWRNVLLYDEHTWGSWNSISEPESDFTIQQWDIKRSFALEAEKAADELINLSVGYNPDKVARQPVIDVYNTSSWPRTDLVIIPAATILTGNVVKNSKGEEIPSQRLTTGELIFIATDIPPFSNVQYFVEEGKKEYKSNLVAKENTLKNNHLVVELDPETGIIKTLRKEGIRVNLVDTKLGGGLNEYYYVKGRDPETKETNDQTMIRVKESGPVLVSLLVESDAPGCNKLSREIRIMEGIDRVDIINTVDKKNVYDQEGVHFGFPFNIPDGKITVDISWGTYEPEKEQLPGSCKNYFTVQRWMDISNPEFGVTWITPDAPLAELGHITADPIATGWVDRVEQTQTIFSYVMNNYWETNYKASQEGEVVFRYSIYPHLAFDPVEAEKRGLEIGQPLIAIPSDGRVANMESFLKINSPGLIVTSVKPSDDKEATLIRIFNAGSSPVNLDLDWADEPEKIFLSSPLQERGDLLPAKYEVVPWEILTLRVER